MEDWLRIKLVLEGMYDIFFDLLRVSAISLAASNFLISSIPEPCCFMALEICII